MFRLRDLYTIYILIHIYIYIYTRLLVHTHSVIVFLGKSGKSVRPLSLQSTSRPSVPVALKHLQLRGHFLNLCFVIFVWPSTHETNTALKTKTSSGKVLNMFRTYYLFLHLYCLSDVFMIGIRVTRLHLYSRRSARSLLKVDRII